MESVIDARVKAATRIDTEKTNVNSEPLYIGPIMVLSDQDATALKHHILSSAVMGTVFASIITVISNPEIPLLWRACLLGGILTGMQAALVALSNVGIAGFELWVRANRPLPFRWIGDCCQRIVGAVWNAYVSAHTVCLANGAIVWIGDFGESVVLSEDVCDE